MSMPHGEEGTSLISNGIINKTPCRLGTMPIDDTSLSLNLDIPDPSLEYPQMSDVSTPPPRRPSIRVNPSPDPLTSPSPQPISPRRSKLASPVFASLRERDDPYFLALPDTSRYKIISSSGGDLNTLLHPPPRVHRRSNRDLLANGNGRLIEQLHSSRRHSSLGVPSQASSDSRPLSRRSSIRPPFRLQRQASFSSESSSPNYGSDSESEIFDDDHSNVGSTVSTRPSSYGSSNSFSENFARSSPSTNADGKIWKRGVLNRSLSMLDMKPKQDSPILSERDQIEAEDCRFLELEYHRYHRLMLI
jgi:hypothetical protein